MRWEALKEPIQKKEACSLKRYLHVFKKEDEKSRGPNNLLSVSIWSNTADPSEVIQGLGERRRAELAARGDDKVILHGTAEEHLV